MDNPEKLATQVTQDKDKKKNLHNVYRKINQKFEINFVSHEFFSEINTGNKQTDGDGVNTQYKSNTKQMMGTYAVNIYG
jgi:D-ribose pyranose/furanose isomerase RbsD